MAAITWAVSPSATSGEKPSGYSSAMNPVESRASRQRGDGKACLRAENHEFIAQEEKMNIQSRK
jgi:hypothetical protein